MEPLASGSTPDLIGPGGGQVSRFKREKVGAVPFYVTDHLHRQYPGRSNPEDQKRKIRAERSETKRSDIGYLRQHYGRSDLAV